MSGILQEVYMNELLEIQDLSKTFKERVAVNHISFTVNKGEVLCLLGPNGAGKSTTIHMIAGLFQCEKGHMLYDGKPISECRKAFLQDIGFVPQEISLYEDITAEQNIRFFASLYGLRGDVLSQRVKEALIFAGLLDRKKDKVKTFSGGMKRRLNIACAIAHHPKLVIMDEPTVGIDPQSRNHILDSIKKLCKQGITILYTTHYMEEVEEISTRIIIMDHGNIIAEGTKETLKEKLHTQRYFILEVEDTKLCNEDAYYMIEGIQEVTIQERSIKIKSLQNIENFEEIMQVAMKQKLKIKNLYCQSVNLETVFLELTGRSLRD